MQYPEGFDPSKLSEKSNKKESLKNNNECEDSEEGPPQKKLKVESYKLDKEVSDLVEKDTINSKLWKEFKLHLSSGKIAFLNHVSKS